MKLSQSLRRERTNVALRAATTFNAPGTFIPQYGKLLFKVGGRGASGNASVPGNYAGTNPSTPGTVANYNPSTGGNYAGTNPSGGGNYAGRNPSTGGNYAGTNPGTTYMNSNTPGNYVPGNNVPASYSPGNPAPGYTNPGSTAPGNYVPAYYDEFINFGSNSCPAGYFNAGFHDGSNYYTQGPICARNVPAYTNPPSFQPGNYVAPYTNPGAYTPAYTNSPYTNPMTPGNSSYVPGNAYYNPTVPGNPYYNPTNPGNAYYNPTVPGSANYNPTLPGADYYNPSTPGNVGTPYSIAGVVFPGGPVGGTAPVVSPTPVLWSYTNLGYPVNVAPGGYVTITPA